jgi:hypothetical protein
VDPTEQNFLQFGYHSIKVTVLFNDPTDREWWGVGNGWSSGREVLVSKEALVGILFRDCWDIAFVVNWLAIFIGLHGFAIYTLAADWADENEKRAAIRHRTILIWGPRHRRIPSILRE